MASSPLRTLEIFSHGFLFNDSFIGMKKISRMIYETVLYYFHFRRLFAAKKGVQGPKLSFVEQSCGGIKQKA
jgi:hypothetical protein